MRAVLAAALLAVAARAADAPPTSGAEGQAPPVRLAASVRPVREALDLDLDPSRQRYRGTARIEVRLDAPADVVWLNAQDLAIASARVETADATLPARVVAGAPGFVGLAPDRAVPAGEAVLTLEFSGAFDRVRSRGLYAAAERGAWYAYTFFEPLDARRAFPCFDEPAFKIPWRISVRVPRGQSAFANAPLASHLEEGDGIRFAFAESKPLPSYLVAVAAGPLEAVEAGTAGAGTPLRFVVPRGRGGETRWAAGVVPRLLAWLEAYTAIPYPYDKLDVLAVPRRCGTMEHPGLVAVGEAELLFDGDPDPGRARAAADLLAHELAHQWFGDLVTMAWWDDTWLNEGFATFLEPVAADALDPAWRETGERRAAYRRAAMSADALPSAKRLREPATSRNDIEGSFDGDLTYAKGAAVLAMFERFVGPDAWRGVVRRHLAARAGGVTTAEDLLAALAAGAGADVADAFRTFLEQPGFPRITLAARCGPGGARVAVAQAPLGPGGPGRRWGVPICFRFGAGAREARACRLLRGATAEWPLPFCPAWIAPNEGGLGYHLAASRPAAPLERLTPAEALAAAADAFLEVATGERPAREALALARRLAHARAPALVEASVDLAGAVRPERLDPGAAERWHAFVRATWGPRARALGLLPAPGEPADAARLRDLLVPFVADAGHEAGLAGEAGAVARRWLSDRRATSPEVAARALAIAARFGDRALFERVAAQAGRSEDPGERAALLGALVRFPDPALVREALALVLDAAHGGGEALAELEEALGTPEGREAAREWLRDRMDDLAARWRSDEVNALLGSLGGAFCDRADREALAAFLPAKVAAFDGAPRALAAALDRIDACASAQALAAPDVARLLRGR